MMKRLAVYAALLLALPGALAAQWTSSRPDGHAPIGVMGDHTHERGEFMFSYRFMYMLMEDLRDGTDKVTPDQVVSPTGYNYTVSPTEMPMMMHMLGGMYALSDAVTLTAMLPVWSREMDHMTRPGGMFTTSSGGISDLALGALIPLSRFGNQALHANVAVSIPTGSVEERDVTPASMGNEVQLPYPMQTGSGTWDLKPGATYLGQAGDWSWGGQASGTLRLGDNSRDWHYGNRLDATFWGARRLGRVFSLSVRGAFGTWGDVEGMDANLNPMMVPTADPALQGGSRMDAGLGINYWVPGTSSLRGLRLAVEGLLPLYQDLHGPQMNTSWMLVAGVQYTIYPPGH